jgi:arsenate reductase
VTTSNVLFLCTGNSARSILAEAILNRLGRGRFTAYSAGSRPAGTVNPHAMELLKKFDHPTTALRSKSWDEFADADSPGMHFVFTVCDNAAGESCPVWPGHPMTAHWGVADPAAVAGTDEEKQAAFAEAYLQLQERIERFLELPFASLDKERLRRELSEIGNR